MATDWRNALFLQARSDFQVVVMLMQLPDLADCHKLHYLQMATEKLAKGFSAGVGPPERNHRAFARFVQTAGSVPGLARESGMSLHQMKPFVAGISTLAEDLEKLAPALAESGPNTEYPWEAGGVVVAPVE